MEGLHRKGTVAVAGFLPLVIFGLGCSEVATDKPPPRVQSPDLTLTSPSPAPGISPLVPLNMPDAGAPHIGPTHAYAVAVAPAQTCSIHPEGITSDSTRTATLVARDDGKVHFDIAPSAAAAWGTRLTLDCALNGVSVSHLVDINDSSTFTSESAADLRPSKIGVRPPLAGNLTAISQLQLTQGSYPLRPDVNSSLYAQWVKAVSTAVDLYLPVPVTILGRRNTGAFVTSYGQPDENWGGFVQAKGFNYSGSGFPYAAPILNDDALFNAYYAFIYVPPAYGCWANTCDDSSLWAGTGGYYIGTPTNRFVSALLQSGFQIDYGFQVSLFVEYTGPAPYDQDADEIPAPGTMTTWDTILVSGWEGDTSCNLWTAGFPAKGCFRFEDLSQTPPWSVPAWQYYPSGAQWWPATVEYISEWHNGNGINANYGGDEMVGTAQDLTGGWHNDPGNPSGSDPYAVLWSQDANETLCNDVQWNNGTIYSPEDPMFFFPLQCGPN